MSAVLCLPACLCVSAAASLGQAPHSTFLFYQDSQVLFHPKVLFLAKRVRRVSVQHTCGYLNAECVQKPFVPSCVATDVYIFIKVHLFLGAPYGWNHQSTSNFTVSSPVTFLLQGNTRVNRGRPQVRTGTLSQPPKPVGHDEIHVEKRVNTIGYR